MDVKAHIKSILIGIQRTPFFPGRVRVVYLKALGFDISRTATIQQDVFFGSRENVRLADDVFIGIGCFFDTNAMIDIAASTRLAPYVRLITGTHPIATDVVRVDPKERNMQLPIAIGRGCWLGVGVIVLPGVSIAEGCVIGAGSILTASTEANGLYLGTPAKRVRDLPTAGQITAV